ncbi:MAG: leucyl aminopeptidase family protein [Myxococcales bacterium]|nr:leucyl aminopeptidase family protein [Myxococcales bacterium]
MTLTFAKTLKALLKGAKTLVLIAPARTLTASRLPKKLLDKRTSELVLELAKDTKPGDLGSSASTLTGREPRRLCLGVLPDTVSHHNAPSRAEMIRRVMESSGAEERGKTAVVLLLEEKEHALAACNAVGRTLPIYSAKERPSRARVQVLCVDKAGDPIDVDNVVKATVDAARRSASFVDTPPSEFHPAAFADAARERLADLSGVEITEIVGDELLAHDLGALHAVGRTGLVAPRLFVASYDPEVEGSRHVALVGKGVTYDTGGLNIKTGEHMSGMKCDMGGAAAVFGAFDVLVRTGTPHRLSLVLCLAENAIGPASFKPDDILRAHSGKTIEINNTDAEGRLCLADGVSFAARVLGADTIIDAATLTGAQLVSTGVLHGAIIANGPELEQIAIEAGRFTGDLTHPLPFAPELFKQEFKSEVADMRNSVKNRMNAQTSCAGQFIYWHLDGTKVDWLHLDLAGPAFPDKRGTGYGVAVLSEVVRRLQNAK